MIEIKRIINYSTGALFALTLLSGLFLSSPFALADNSATNDITINVPVSCNLSSSNTTAHTATIDAGTYRADIGESTITATCNDAGGFAIYAIGYGNDTHGNNTLTHTTNPDFSIVSGTATSGATSNWAMKLTAVEGTYTPTIENGFDSYSTVPETNTKVASHDSVTDQTNGASFKSTYAAYIAPTQYAGTYEGKVKYTLVHPSTDANNILYMQNVDEWGDSIEVGQTVYAVDTRDGEGYTVARLADGNLWMTKNLRLNLETANISAENTNNPTEAFLEAVSSKPSSDDEAWCNSSTEECINRIGYNTANLGDNTISDEGYAFDEYGVYYNYFTATAGNGSIATSSQPVPGDICPKGWHLPMGGNSGDIAGLISSLGGNTSVMDSSSIPTGEWMQGILRSSPNNFRYSGRYYNTGISQRGTYGRYWTSTANISSPLAVLFGIADDVVYPGNSSMRMYNGLSVRCVDNKENYKDAILDTGTVINTKMIALASGPEEIKAIHVATSLPEGFEASSANTISTVNSKHPIYIFFDNTNDAGVMNIYSGNHMITGNSNMSNAFAEFSNLTDISGIADWDMSGVKYMTFMFRDANSLAEASAVYEWDTSNVSSMYGMFYKASSLESLNLSHWNTSNVERFDGMFEQAKSLRTINLTNWNTSRATSMFAMFEVGESHLGDGQLTEIIGLEDWDTSNVTNMSWMFYGAGNMTHYNISNWDVSKVESFNHMFCDNFKLESLDLSHWNIQNVKTMYDMFDDNYALTTIGDVSHWNTSNLIDVGGWLNGASSFVGDNGTLDLSGWDTSNLKVTGEMFRATKLQTIDLSGWTFNSITNDSWDGAGSGIYGETGNTSYYKGLAGMFLNMPQLQTVYVSQTGLNSYNAAVARGVDITDMWSGSNISGFTVKP